MNTEKIKSIEFYIEGRIAQTQLEDALKEILKGRKFGFEHHKRYFRIEFL